MKCARRVSIVSMIASTVVILTCSSARADDDDKEVTPSDGSPTGFWGRASGGASYGSVFDLTYAGPSASLDLGGYFRHHLALSGGITYAYAHTPDGLTVQNFSIGATFERAFDRIHIGGGLDFAYLSFARATESASISTSGVGAHAIFEVDLWQIDRHALFFEVRPECDIVGFIGPIAWKGNAELGLRW
jgi:hypothetical protein